MKNELKKKGETRTNRLGRLVQLETWLKEREKPYVPYQSIVTHLKRTYGFRDNTCREYIRDLYERGSIKRSMKGNCLITGFLIVGHGGRRS